MSAAAELTGAHMKYLAVIYEVSCAGNTVSCAEVARRLGVTRPSVSRMLDVLNEKGMTTKERYGKIALTEEGLRVAQRVKERTVHIAQLLSAGLHLNYRESMAAASAVAQTLPDRILSE